MTLHPVIVPVPQSAPSRSPEQVRAQRDAAYAALTISAKKSFAPDAGWTKDADGAPEPNDGWHWSVSHKRLFAAGVVASHPVGIDVEQIAPRARDLHDALATDAEWSLLGDRSWAMFFRLWTAKEATLKANRVGIGKLLKCRLIEVEDDTHGKLEYDGRVIRVEHYYHADHVFAVTCNDSQVQWRVIDT